jgi:hypothetical protein
MGCVEPYELGDETQLVPKLRAEDFAELTACSTRPPVELLREGAVQSVPSCSILNTQGEVVGMFGVVPVAPRCGQVWLLGSDELTKNPLRRQFIRESRMYLNALHQQYPLLFNVISETNTIHIRWLKWLHFTFIRRIPAYGLEQRPYMEFAKCVCL